MSRLFKVFYWPICRAYARHLRDRPADTLMHCLSIPQFWWAYRFLPNFVQPRRFSEKVWHRQLYERDPRLTMISDKFRVRDYVAAKIGSNYLIPLLWNGDKPEEIPFDNLPQKFVIKTNHGCGYNIIIQDKTRLDKKKVILKLKKWLKENFGEDYFIGIAWAYKNIRPHIIIETFVEENEKPPVDYKFFCFSGRMEFFKIDFDRFEGHSEKFFNKELNGLDVIELGLKQYKGKIDIPDNFDDMVRVAEKLSAEFDFMRVDLYSSKNKVYFSELTPYPGGVAAKFVPDSFDYIFGDKWKTT